MDTELLRALAILAAMGVAVAFERRADAARKREAETASSAVVVVVKMPAAVSPTERVEKSTVRSKSRSRAGIWAE